MYSTHSCIVRAFRGAVSRRRTELRQLARIISPKGNVQFCSCYKYKVAHVFPHKAELFTATTTGQYLLNC